MQLAVLGKVSVGLKVYQTIRGKTKLQNVTYTNLPVVSVKPKHKFVAET